MARRYVRCGGCGRMQLAERVFEEHGVTEAMLCTIGGRGMCRWEAQPLTLAEAHALEANLQRALANVRAAIANAEQG